jgi:glyoxylase-like metal-dependent hydrolase (beta-lactamase superfamily II)
VVSGLKLSEGFRMFVTRLSMRCAGALFGFCLALPMQSQAPRPDGAGVEAGVLPARWGTSGPKCMEVPDWQVHEYNPDFLIVRQSGCLDYEKPFLYLIFGRDRALLYDTGSDNFPAAEMVRNVVGKWLRRNHRDRIPLVVVHSHDHSDHVFGDEQLKKLQNDPAIPVTFVPAEVEASKRFYGITNWPDEIVSLDLGGRLLDVIPIPGHNVVSVALYDRRTAILLTGDSLYPGRLYVDDFAEFVKSTDRLVKFTKGRIVAHILGCHIEQTETPYLDYPMGTIYQPHERALEMSRGDLLTLQEALASLHGKAAKLAMRDFTIWPVPSPPADHVMDKFHALQKEQIEHMWAQRLEKVQ